MPSRRRSAVDEVTSSFLGQGAVALPCQRVSAHEELLEHSRTSTKGETGDRLDYTRGSYVTCKRQDVQESHNEFDGWLHKRLRYTISLMWCTT
jgi:hypothetical protein